MGAILRAEISEKLNALLDTRASIKLLEAGCGSSSYFTFVPTVYTVGIDISQEQLDRNRVIQKKIRGDLETYPLPKEEFDVVVCWDVIEHLATPTEALMSMFNATKPDGFVVLGFPNLWSFKGLATKLTPLWFHEKFYRLIMSYTGQPFKTYLRLAISPRNLMRFATVNGLDVMYYSLVEGEVTEKIRKRWWPLNVLFVLCNAVGRFISFGRCQSMYLDSCALILKKRRT